MTLADPTYAAAPSAPSSAVKSGARVRDVRLDFFRGIAMFIILFAHTPGNWFTLWIPARWGFSDATEIFVFCSGMASAIAFGKAFETRGFGLGTARVSYRIWQVYWAHIGLFFAVAATMVLLNSLFPVGELNFIGEENTRNYIGQLNLVPFFRDTQENLFGLLTLTYVPNYFDILPMYMVILAMMPLMVLLKRVHVGLVIAAMAILWLMAQGRILETFGLGEFSWNFPAEPWSQREWFFNPFGWQLVFFTGFAFMAGWFPAPPVKAWLIALAAAIVLIIVPFSNIGMREFGFGAMEEGGNWVRTWRIENRIWITKSDFGILRYIHFLALAYLAWVIVGPKGSRIQPTDGTSLGAQSWRVFMALLLKVGQQSLAVFIGSMFLARLLGALFDQVGRTYFSMLWVNLLGCALIIGVAYGAGWFKSQPWKAKRSNA
ncbi:MAG: OpgC domain-containing protein [Pseudomonadota bacterium]